MKNVFLAAAVSLFVLLISSCQTGVEKINFGEDHCDYCKMSIADPKYGAEAITAKGRVYKFDAIECMIPYLHENKEMDFDQLYAIAYDQPKVLVNVDALTFARSSKYRSPMGANLAAFEDASKIDEKAEQMQWEALKDGLMAN